jgi:hypothetical protein
MSTTPTPPPSANTGIEVTARHSVLAFILALFKPVITIDGRATPARWKEAQFFPVAPGQHQVQVHFPYLFIKEAGRNATTVNVQPGQTVRVSYKAPWIVFMKGKLQVA